MKLFNRVGFSTPTIGTDNLAIGAAIRSATDGDYLTPAEAGAVDGDQSPYFIVDGHSFAQGLGTYSSTGPTLVRDPAERNWNGTTEAAGKLALSGNAVVFISPRAVDLVSLTDGDKGDIVVTDSGTIWNFDSSVVSAFARTFLDDADAATVRATLGLVIGSAVQAFSERLANFSISNVEIGNGHSRVICSNVIDNLLFFRGGTWNDGAGLYLYGSANLGAANEALLRGVNVKLQSVDGSVTYLNVSTSAVSVSNPGAWRTGLGLVIGTNVQAQNAALQDLATSNLLTSVKNRTTPRIVSGTSDTLVLADEGKRIETTNGSATTITVPENASVAFPVGTQIDLMQIGAGQVTVVGASGAVVINGTPGLKLRSQWSAATLIKRFTNTWVLVGDLSA